jgi:hypothetical protein
MKKLYGTCGVCRSLIAPKTRIFQLAVGYYYRGFETPSYESHDAVIYECHENCLASSLEPQGPPYDCSLCNRRLFNGTRVIYLVVGNKPAPGYKRPERRGHEMPFIAHDHCFENEFEPQPMKTRALTATGRERRQRVS